MYVELFIHPVGYQVFAIRFYTGFWLELYCYEVVKHVMYLFSEKKLMSRSCFVLLIVIIVISSLKEPVSTHATWSNQSQYYSLCIITIFEIFFLLFSWDIFEGITSI